VEATLEHLRPLLIKQTIQKIGQITASDN